MCQKQQFVVVAAILASFCATDGVGGHQSPRSPTPEKRAASKLYESFDADKLMQKHASRFDEAPLHTNVVANITITPPGDTFKLFRIKGKIADDGLAEVISSLRSDLARLAMASGVKVVHGPTITVRDRPIQLLHVLFLGETVELKSLRGFYFTYTEEKIAGAVDAIAARCLTDDGMQWKIVCAVHEATR